MDTKENGENINAVSKAGNLSAGNNSHNLANHTCEGCGRSDLAEQERRRLRALEVVAQLSVIGALLCFIGVGVTYWVGGQNQFLGGFLAAGLALLGIGVIVIGKYFMPQGPFVEQRHEISSTVQQKQLFEEALVERGGSAFKRRKFLGVLMGASATMFGITFAFPWIRSLGPLPGKTLFQTWWRPGSRVVTVHGRPVKVDDLEVGGILTVFPEGHAGSSMSQTILIRAASLPITTRKGRETWSPHGYLGFSKICTHAGCPVGLYEEQSQQLLCPCHQSIFDVLDGAVPVFGPAPRPLPQLPLGVDEEGYLRARSDFLEPVGPGFWERTTA